jgi:two-component system, NtrC family, sensor kinase
VNGARLLALLHSSRALPRIPDLVTHPEHAENHGAPRLFWRLQTRLTLLTAVLVLIAAGVITYLFQRLSVDAMERARYGAASDVAASIALRIAAGIPPTPRLEGILAEYVHENSEIVAASVLIQGTTGKVEVLSTAGKDLREFREQEEAALTGERVARIVEHAGERFWSIGIPIDLKKRGRGAVGVWSSLQAVELLTRETRRLAFIVLPISLAVLVTLLSLVFRSEVHGPTESLRRAMVRVEQGDLTAEAKVVRSDEIGFITWQYNRMLARIRKTQEEREELLRRVQGFNEELSRTVEQATAELTRRNLELERLNQELFLLQQRLIRIERQSVAQQVAARLAHKIGTPLNLISGHVQMLNRTRPEDRELHEKLGIVQAQIERLTDTVRDILDETRASLRREPIGLDGLLEHIGALLGPTLTARKVELRLRLAAGNLRVEGVEDQLEQVFLTLINNSLDALPRGGCITVATSEEPGGIVRARLQDDGEGIPEGILPQIFRPFFTTKAGGQGTGLGLSIVQEILAAHRATIRVESAVGQGTTFVIDFPALEALRKESAS